MKKHIINCIVFLVLSSAIGFSQDMKKGFTFLETGKYKPAVSFFEKVLRDYPDNKTAKLCYGRAVGLNGDAPTAVGIFTEMLKDYPGDFEIKLNYAESLLWNKQYEAAENYYQKLAKENETSFPALLGFANTLSNLKKYPEALLYVDKALLVLPGNPNAMVSKKYIQLGYADVLTKQQKYAEAVSFLKSNLLLFKNDKATLKNLVNTYVIAKEYENAKQVYYDLAITKNDSIFSLNGLSLIAHFENKNKAALKISNQALQMVSNVDDKELYKQTKSRNIQALIWNKKYKQAKKDINLLIKKNPDENWPISLRATLNIYKGDFKKTISDYDKILETEASSFDGNLGKANALKASGKINAAYAAAKQTLKYYDNQKDVLNFIKGLDKTFTPYAVSKTAYSFDNGENSAILTELDMVYPISTKTTLKGQYSYRTTQNDFKKNNASVNSLFAGLSQQLAPNVILNAMAGIVSTDVETENYQNFLTTVSLNLKPFKLNSLEIGYKREMETFNADLLEKEIVKNNYFANYNMGTNFNLGWFTQYYYTAQSDGNARNLLFTSLYYNILSKPALKAGFNFQAIAFKEQKPNDYFSPEKFKAYEVFIDLMKDEYSTKNKSMYYNLNAALGLQYIEDQSQQSTYRVQAKLGYKFSSRLVANIYGLQSNIASAVTSANPNGFTYTEFGLRVQWHFRNGPSFSRK
ncbi:tetratricopeptide repeat protein [Bacteroidota bacterium]